MKLDYDLEVAINPGGRQARIAITPEGELTKPEGMTEAEAITLAVICALGQAIPEHCKFMQATWRKWGMPAAEGEAL